MAFYNYSDGGQYVIDQDFIYLKRQRGIIFVLHAWESGIREIHVM